MHIRTATILIITIAIMFIAAVTAEVIVDDFVKPTSLFTYLVFVTLVNALITLIVNIDMSS
jgi:hypothetical protein